MKRLEIPKGQAVFMSYPNIQRMMCGVHYAQQDRDGLITVVYEDGTSESRAADFKVEDKSVMDIVSFVQKSRKED